MDDQALIGYALDLLDPADRSAVEAHLAEHPETARQVERLRLALRPLEADRDDYEPPAGLATAAIARTVEYAIANQLIELPRDPSKLPTPASLRSLGSEPNFPGLGWRRADLAVAGCIGFLAVGLLVSGVGKVRMESQIRGCQNNLRQLHTALAGYSSVHGGRLPKVGSEEVPVAGAFADELARAGQLPAGGLARCPSSSPTGPNGYTPRPGDLPPVSYAYTLGYKTPGGAVEGLRMTDAQSRGQNGLPVAADLPVPGGRSHTRGLNVLFAGGAVRFCTTPSVGVNGDDIFSNAAGLPRAGLFPEDSSLGRPYDVP